MCACQPGTVKLRRIVSAYALLVLIGCDDSAPPPPPPVDGGPMLRDGELRDVPIVDVGSPRRDGALLPAADIEVVLPYLGDEVVEERIIDAQPGRLDVHFSIDTTGSFGGEIDALQRDLSSRIIPTLEDRVNDVAFGVSRFEDFPIRPYGSEGDSPFQLLASMSRDRSRAQSGVARLDQPLGAGGDAPESGYEALYQIATGEGLFIAGVQYVNPFGGTGLGGVGFRAQALHVVVHVTDATSHVPSDYADLPGTHGEDDAIDALAEIEGYVIGIASGEGARPQLERMALATDAWVPEEGGACATGIGGETHPPSSGRCPLVFDIDPEGNGLSDAIIDAIVGLLDSVQYEEVYGEVLDDRLGFVKAVEALEAIPVDGAMPPRQADLRPMDGIDDTFQMVRIGTDLRFAIRMRNTTIPPATYDQIFRLTVQILGDGNVLDEVTIRVIVPAGFLDAGITDAGAGDAGADAGADAGDAGADAGADGG